MIVLKVLYGEQSETEKNSNLSTPLLFLKEKKKKIRPASLKYRL